MSTFSLREIRALGLAQGEHVEQALGRMRAAAVAGVEQRDVPGFAAAASAATAPSFLWRITKPRTPIASRFLNVSSAVSPLVVDEVDASKLSTSRAQPLRGQLEAQARARGRFEEQRAHGDARKRVARIVRRRRRPAHDRAAPRVAARGRSVQREQVFQLVQSCVRLGFVVRSVAIADEGRDSVDSGIASCGAASQRSTMTAAATASSASASRRRLRPSARSAAKRCAASIELARSSTSTTGSW